MKIIIADFFFHYYRISSNKRWASNKHCSTDTKIRISVANGNNLLYDRTLPGT